MSVNPWSSRHQLDNVVRVIAIVFVIGMIAAGLYVVSLPEGSVSRMQVDQ